MARSLLRIAVMALVLFASGVVSDAQSPGWPPDPVCAHISSDPCYEDCDDGSKKSYHLYYCCTRNTYNCGHYYIRICDCYTVTHPSG